MGGSSFQKLFIQPLLIELCLILQVWLLCGLTRYNNVFICRFANLTTIW